MTTTLRISISMADPAQAARIARFLDDTAPFAVCLATPPADGLASDADAVVLDPATLRATSADPLVRPGTDAVATPVRLLCCPTLDAATLELLDTHPVDDWFFADEPPASLRRRLVRRVTERRAARAAAEKADRVAATLEQIERFARIGYYDYSASTGICVASESLRSLLGLAPDYARAPETFMERVLVDDRPDVAQAAATAERTGRAADVDHRIVRADTGELRHFASVIEAELDPSGAVRNIRGISQDLSTHWRSAMERLAAQKLQAVGQLAGGVAHDFNNLLAVVLMNASLLRGSLTLDEDQSQDLDQILQAGMRGKELVQQLLSFSERTPAPGTPLDFSVLVADLARFLRRLLREDIALAFEVEPGARVLGDPGELEQLVLNLVMNARDAQPMGGRIGLRVAVEPDPVDPNTGWARLSVADAGPGIPPETMAHLFEPFFTTKPVGGGPGLGLAAVHGIVVRHGGRIDVRSGADGGTVFEVRLPLHAGEVASPRRPGASATTGAPGSSRRGDILVVEDEPVLRTLLARVLVEAGYTIHTAESGVSALAAWPDLRARVGLLLTDVVMPGGVTGETLAGQLLADSPALSVLYMTGHAEVGVGPKRVIPDADLLRKPFLPETLVAAVSARIGP